MVSQQWHFETLSGIHGCNVKAQVLRCLVVPATLGATTGCTTICHLPGHASLATVGYEAPGTMYSCDSLRRPALVSELGGDC